MVDDWPRLKPQYNVDLAFIQIGIGVAILTVAFLMGGRVGALMAPLTAETPKATAAPPEQENSTATPGR